MKTIWCSLLFLIGLTACEPPAVPETVDDAVSSTELTSGYDPEYAAKVGADEYGMRQFVMAFLKAGPNRPQDSIKAAELQAAHMANINRMAEAGKLLLAGPFLDDGDLRGIYIFNVETIEEARALTASDPAIQAGSLVMELKPWYGSAALVGFDELYKRLEKPVE